MAALTSNGVGTCGADDNQAQAGHLVVDDAYQCHGNNVGPMGTLRQGNGAVTGGVPFVVQPLAIRGREGGAMLEIGPDGGPYNALRAGDGGSSRQPLVCITGQVTHTLTSEGADAPEDGSGRGTPIVAQPAAVHENQRGEITTPPLMGTLKTGGGKPGQRYPCVAISAPDVAATLTAGTSSPGVSAPGRRQEDDHNIVAISYTAGIDPQVSEQVTPTIKAGHDTMPSIHTGTVVRRLTEMECERLQGYPDGWTDGQSGSARYRQLGNSVAVPVVEWIARRIVAVDKEIAL